MGKGGSLRATTVPAPSSSPPPCPPDPNPQGFTAPFSNIANDHDDFINQLRVMITRTESVTADDLLSISCGSSAASTIACEVVLPSDGLAAALTTAIEGKHLSVYIGRVGYIAVITGTDSPAQPTSTAAPRPTTTVTVVFNGVPEGADEAAWITAINASLVVTGTIGAGDLATVVFTPHVDGLYATVAVRSATAAAAIARAAAAQRFRVAIGSMTYSGKLSSLPSDSTAPTTPAVTSRAVKTEPPASTAHPAEDGFVWLNEYTADNENIMDCSAGHDWSGIVISKMPVGCHRFQHEATKQDEFNFLALDQGTGAVSQFGMVCDTQCSSCISNQATGMEFNSCQSTWGGSVAVYPAERHCLGASYIEVADGALSIFRYSGAQCELDTDLSDTLYIRNYPAPVTGAAATCTADGSTGTFYALTRTADENGEVFFSGQLGCSDSDCSDGCTEIAAWQEGACEADKNGKGIRIWETTNVLKECASAAGVQQQPIEESGQGAQLSAAEVEVFPAEIITETAPAVGTEAQSSADDKATAEVDATAVLVIVNQTEDRISGAPAAPADATAPATNVTAAPKLPDESRMWESVPVKQLRVGAAVHQSLTQQSAPSPDAPGYNRQFYALLLAGAGVLAVSFVVIGVLYRRKHASRSPPGEEDIMRDFRAYAEASGHTDDYHDDRLITDI